MKANIFGISALALSLTPALLFAGEPGCNTNAPLNAPVDQFHVRHARLIEALLRFGIENRICFGVDELDEDLLTTTTDFDISGVRASAVVNRILTRSPNLVAIDDNGIVVLKRRPQRSKLWLDFVIPNFEPSRNTVPFTSLMVYFALIRTLDPSITGLGGDIAGADRSDIVGPFQEKGATVRTLLNKIVASSKGAMWISHDDGGVQTVRPEKGPFGVILQYQTDYDLLIGQLSSLRPTPREIE